MECRRHAGSVGDDIVHSAIELPGHLALHAKLDELLRVDSCARSELAWLDEQDELKKCGEPPKPPAAKGGRTYGSEITLAGIQGQAAQSGLPMVRVSN